MGRYDYLMGVGFIGVIGGSIMLWGWKGLLLGAGLTALACAIYMNEE